MADPRSELADIIVPLAPAAATGTSGLPGWLWAAGLLSAACVALLVWQWRRQRFARSLRAIAAAVARQQGTPAELSSRLDAWARVRFKLPRLDAARCPQGLDADSWSGWVNALTQRRFAPSLPGSVDDLAALCAAARRWLPHA